jgi:hypothetical protein
VFNCTRVFCFEEKTPAACIGQRAHHPRRMPARAPMRPSAPEQKPTCSGRLSTPLQHATARQRSEQSLSHSAADASVSHTM